MSSTEVSTTRRYRVPAIVAVAALVLLAPLIGAADAKTGILHRIDLHTANSLNSYLVGHPAQRSFWQAVTDIGGPLTWRLLAAAAAVIIYLWVRHRHADATLVVLVMVGAALISGAVKTAVARARPTVPHPIEHVAGGSFPSGHALTSAAAMGLVVVLTWPRLRAHGHRVAAVVVAIAAGLVALLVGVSRLMLGVHYPTDVVGGWLFALLCLSVSMLLIRGIAQLLAWRTARNRAMP